MTSVPRRLCALAAVLACRAPPADLPPPSLREILAVSDTASFPVGRAPDTAERRARGFADLADLGVGLLRRDFLWHEIEPERGRFDFDPYDALVDDAAAHGVELLALLAYGNPWAAGGAGDVHVPPDDPADFAAFAAAVADRYRGRVRRFEVWNEPNHPLFWLCAEACPLGDAARYAALIESTYAALHAVDSTVEVAFGGTVYLSQIGTLPTGPEFARVALAAGAADAFDAMAFHAYSSYPPLAPPEASSELEVSLPDKIAAFDSALAAAGRAGTPLWLTEIGWPAAPSGVSEEDQARFLVRATLIAAASCEVVALFDLRDGPDPDAYPPEQAFGLLRADGTEKPANRAVATLMGTLGDLGVRRCAQDAGLWICDLAGAGGRGEALWVAGDAPPIFVRPADGARVVTMLGDESPAGAEVEVGPDPVYLLTP